MVFLPLSAVGVVESSDGEHTAHPQWVTRWRDGLDMYGMEKVRGEQQEDATSQGK